ncbi:MULTISPECIES: serine hydrolase [Frankia]|nr:MULTISPECIES: serine hydrolase [Frankia]
MVLLTVTGVAGGVMYWPAGEAPGSAGLGGPLAVGAPAAVSAPASAARAGGLGIISPALVRRRVEAVGTGGAAAPATDGALATRQAGGLATVEPIAAVRGAASSGLAARFRGYLAGRPGHVSVAMYDAVAGTTAVYTDPAVAGYETASSVKLDILTALVQRAGASGRLTAREQALARRMISVSDNAAASALWADVGGAPAMNAFFARLGMHATTAGPGGKWGLTRTTGADQLAVLRAIAYPGTLSAAGRATVSSLLRTVIPAQRWGLTGGVAAGVAVELKNGWLPRTSGWVITSLAHVHGAGRDYIMAVYTKNGPSMQSGITTVQGLSTLAWKAARSSTSAG